MTLLFDENLSFRLAAQLADVYPDSLHVRDVGLVGRPDEEMWQYAARESCAIVTKDIDFYQRVAWCATEDNLGTRWQYNHPRHSRRAPLSVPIYPALYRRIGRSVS